MVRVGLTLGVIAHHMLAHWAHPKSTPSAVFILRTHCIIASSPNPHSLLTNVHQRIQYRGRRCLSNGKNTIRICVLICGQSAIIIRSWQFLNKKSCVCQTVTLLLTCSPRLVVYFFVYVDFSRVTPRNPAHTLWQLDFQKPCTPCLCRMHSIQFLLIAKWLYGCTYNEHMSPDEAPDVHDHYIYT